MNEPPIMPASIPSSKEPAVLLDVGSGPQWVSFQILDSYVVEVKGMKKVVWIVSLS